MKKVIFRVIGSGSYGYGNIARSLILADGIRNASREVVFIYHGDSSVGDYITSRGYRSVPAGADILDAESQECAMLEIISYQPDLLINDIKDTNIKYMKAVKENDIKVLSFDDLGQGRRLADVLVDANKRSAGRSRAHYFGPDYIVLKEGFGGKKKKSTDILNKSKKILISLGGADHNNLSTKIVDFLKERVCVDMLEIVLVVGPGFSGYQRKCLEQIKNSCIKLLDAPGNMDELMFESDIAILSGGITMFEAACVGLPSLVVCQVGHQIFNANYFQQKGVVINLGLGDTLKKDSFDKALENLMSSRHERKLMSIKGKKLVDGKGRKRILSVIDKIVK